MTNYINIYCLVNGVEVQMTDYGMLSDFIELKELKPKQYLFYLYIGNTKHYLQLENNFDKQF